MQIEKIKTELTQRVNQLMSQRKKNRVRKIVNDQISRPWSEKVAETEEIIHKVYRTLNDLLLQNQIQFSDELEREGFVSYLEPTINDLVIRNMDD
ncbi:MAG: hypothetical protein WBG46_15275 [Nonlabens sp.]